MIKFVLRCDRGHAFDSWFRDGAAYDRLAGGGGLSCPECGSASVAKAVMAPALLKGSPSRPLPGPGPTSPPQPVAMVAPEERKLRDMVRALHRTIAETSENVGPAFATEARRIHEGEAPERSIHGQASGEEVRALLEDGVPLMPIPPLPDERN